jgi:hypothetical protein
MSAMNALLDPSNWSYETPRMARRLSGTFSPPDPPQKKRRLLTCSPFQEPQPNDDKIGAVPFPTFPSDFDMAPYKKPHLAPRLKLRTCSLPRKSTIKKDSMLHSESSDCSEENDQFEIVEKNARCAWCHRMSIVVLIIMYLHSTFFYYNVRAISILH